MRQTIVVFFTTYFLLACTPIATPAPDPTTVPTTIAGEGEWLTFTAQESTFLSHIEDALASRGVPDSRRYVEFTGEDNAMWQGEHHAYADNDIYYLQRKSSGGENAVRVTLPTGAQETELRSFLPPANGESSTEPNVHAPFVRARSNGNGAWTFDVSIEHPDTGWDDYADAWHIESPEGHILGMRILLHPHVNEQPFTRSLSGVIIPETITEVRIRPHELRDGYGPPTVAIPLAQPSKTDSYEVVR